MKLIFDLKYSGHHIEFLIHLVEYIESVGLQSDFYFIVHEKTKHIFKGTLVKYEVITLDSISNKRKAYYFLDQKVKERNYSELILMELDFYRKFFLFNPNSLSIPIRTILFVNPLRVKNNNTIITRFTTLVRRFYRSVELSIILKNNSNIKSIFILNDKKSIDRLKNKYGNIFYFLPDPVFLNLSLVRNKERSDDLFKLLIIGTIDERKNILTLLDAAKKISDALKVIITIAGKGKSKKLEETIKQHTKNNSAVVVKRDDRYLEHRDFINYINDHDVISVMYKDFYFSSGILNYSIVLNRPVICSNYGLIPELVTEYGIGESCNPSDTDEVANTLLKINSKSYSFTKIQDLVGTPHRFASEFLS